MTHFKTGDRVKHSAYALRSKWERYLGEGGSRKGYYKELHDIAARLRGTVHAAEGSAVNVHWDDGTTSDALDYMIVSE